MCVRKKGLRIEPECGGCRQINDVHFSSYFLAFSLIFGIRYVSIVARFYSFVVHVGMKS